MMFFFENLEKSAEDTDVSIQTMNDFSCVSRCFWGNKKHPGGGGGTQRTVRV